MIGTIAAVVAVLAAIANVRLLFRRSPYGPSKYQGETITYSPTTYPSIQRESR